MKFPTYLLFLLLLVSKATQSYVIGYTRLRDPQTGRVVEVFYDIHAFEKNLKAHELDDLTFKEIKQRLYPTEQVFLEALERMKELGLGVAVVGESHGEGVDAIFGTFFEFISAIGVIVPSYFAEADYRHGDYARWKCLGCPEFNSIFRFCLEIDSFAEDFELFCRDILPVSDELKNAIALHSGEKASQKFFELYQTTLGDFYTKLEEFIQCLRACNYKPIQEHEYVNLADLEMLMHILSSPHPRIFVYAGAYHGQGIVEFLRDKLGYQVLADHHAKDYDYRDLELMIENNRRRGIELDFEKGEAIDTNYNCDTELDPNILSCNLGTPLDESEATS